MRYTYLLVALATLLLSGCFGPNVGEVVTQPTVDTPVTVLAHVDYDNDGVVDYTNVYEYNPDGNIGVVTDTVGSYKNTYIYTDGLLTERQLDHNNDGLVEEVVTFEYDLYGYLFAKYWDENNDGVPEYANYYDNDADGNVIDIYRDDDMDGTYDVHYIHTYTDGKITSWKADVFYDGIIDYSRSYVYDANTITELHDDYDDGVIDYSEVYTYSGDLLIRVDYLNGDGSSNGFDEYTYDANGYPLTYVEDHDGDGVIDSTVTYENTY